MKLFVRKDLVSGVFFLLLSIAVWFLIPAQIKVRTDSVVNSQTFPKLLAVVIFFCSVVLIAKDIVRIRNKDMSSLLAIELMVELKAVAVVGFLAVYAVLIPLIGFLYASIAFGCMMLLFFKSRNIVYYGVVVALCFVLTYVFKTILLVQLP